MRGLVQGDDAAFARTGGGEPVDARVVRVEERALTSEIETENVGGVGVDHPAVTDHDDLLPGMGLDQTFDGADDAGDECLFGLVGRRPLSVEHGLPAGIVGGLQFLDGDVFVAVAVVFGHPVERRGRETEETLERFGGLAGAPHRAAVQGVDGFARHVFGRESGLAVAGFR